MSEQPNVDIVSLIKKMQQQLDSLERKIDALAQQSQARPPYRAPSSFNPTDRRPREHGSRDRGPREYSPREHGTRDQGSKRPFEQRSSEEKRPFSPKFAPKFSTKFSPKKKSFSHGNRKDSRS